ncbi:MAG TPA: hypothetical protein VJ112_04480 [Rhabdochlamydiaceae bacterium]|nr:hypothetical protein [Rhabdochlamydiaceae bacterium]
MHTGTVQDSKDIVVKIQAVNEQMLKIIARTDKINNEQDLEKLELEVQLLMREFGDLIIAQKVQQNIDKDEAFRASVIELAHQCRKTLVNKGRVSVQIRFSGGTIVSLRVTYWARKGAAGRRGKGLYPELYLLGMHDHCTPFLASEVAQAAAALCSFEEARHMMESRGCPLDVKTVRNIAKRFACRARLGQKAASVIEVLRAEDLKGRRVVLSSDGGRLRIRTPKRGRRTKKKRSRYSTDWREPKLLIIYVVNDEGRIDKKILPLIDGTLKGTDALFALLHIYLRSLNLSAVDQILFVADGAHWIWDAIQCARKMLNLIGFHCKIIELIDFYHAVQHLHGFAEHKCQWSGKKRKQWVSQQKTLLKSGKTKKVLENLRMATKGSKNKLLQRELMYFVNNQERLSYQEVAAQKLPIGSGAIESAVRRVINLRLKSPCIYWKEDTAEEMLLLRAYYKSGRWNLLKKMAYEGGLLYAA